MNENQNLDILEFFHNFEKEIKNTNIFLRETGGLSPAGPGNVAIRVPGSDEQFIIASFASPLNPDPAGAVVMSLDGDVILGNFSKNLREVTNIYIEIFRSRRDVKAAIHTHAVYLTAFSVAGRKVPCSHISLPRFNVRVEIPVAKWSPRFDGSTVGCLLAEQPEVPAVLHGNHGVFVFGDSITEAAKRLVFLEEAARIIYLAEQLGGAKLLPEGAYADIQSGMTAAGF